mgnify:CR=1 FL=1
MNAFIAFLGLAAYGKCLQADAARERQQLAADALRQRAQDLQAQLQDMELDAITDPGRHSARQLRAARNRADRAQEAALLAEAGIHQP